jgi:hypothetical protein
VPEKMPAKKSHGEKEKIMLDLKIGSRVLCPCPSCDLPDDVCFHSRDYATVTKIGKAFVTVKLERPPFNWRARGLSDHTRYRAARLRVLS